LLLDVESKKIPNRVQKYAYGFFCAAKEPLIQPLEKHEEEPIF
jgi:hypothetical protein